MGLWNFFPYLKKIAWLLNQNVNSATFFKGYAGLNSKWPDDLFICDPVSIKSDPTFLFVTRPFLIMT